MRNLLLALPFLLSNCSVPIAVDTTVPAHAFSDRINASAQLVDVRTAAEFKGGHLLNAVNLDWTGGQLEAMSSTLDKTRPVLLYCASGRRSADARGYLVDQGFTDVVGLEGGITSWRSSGMPVEP
ncbi:MAG: rhodanese-like domain-containing protein [Flavobacteriales bacterium]